MTVTFSRAASFPDIRIAEYSGADPNNPVDVTAASHRQQHHQQQRIGHHNQRHGPAVWRQSGVDKHYGAGEQFYATPVDETGRRYCGRPDGHVDRQL